MIILDTNVLSELTRTVAEPNLLRWLQAQSAASLFTTTISRSEMLYGVQILPEGVRRSRLRQAVLQIFSEDFAGRVLNFDSDAADAYAEIAAHRRSLGRPISVFDAAIAGIARACGAALATRNVRDFGDCGVVLINPWLD